MSAKHKTGCTFLAIILLGLGMLLPSQAYSKDVPFRILPWNGFKAAISLTYDDGDPIHLDVAVPEMAKRGLRGTFFIIAKDPARFAEWGPVAASGQEIGNHSWTHRHTSELKPEEEKTEVTDARTKLEGIAKKPVLSFAYPFVEISPGLKKWVEANDIVARGGSAPNYYLNPDSEPDWMNIPSQATMSAYAYETYKDWVDQDLSQGAWTVLMIHAIEGSTWFQPIPKDIYLKFLDYLVENKKDLWVAPFGEVGGYWKAQKVLEQAEPKKSGKRTVIRWKKPDLFPTGIILKARIEGKGLTVTQGGKAIKALSENVYPVSFDAQELTLTNADWKAEEKQAEAKAPAAKAPVFLPAAAVPDKDVLKVDDFESSAPVFGASWWEGCDSNGVTKLLTMPFAPVAGGSPKTPGHCAAMKGTMGPMQEPWPWAILSLAMNASNTPVDLTAYKAVRFYTKGDGKSHVLTLNKASVTDYCDFQAEFVSPKEWTLVTLPYTAFAQASWGKQLEKKFNDVTKISFSPGTSGPAFDFLVDDIELLKEIPEGSDAVKKEIQAKTDFHWKDSGPLVVPIPNETHPILSVKDPTVVKVKDTWHVIATTANQAGAWNMVDLKFKDWSKAVSAKPFYMDDNPNLKGYHCAPNVFYFTPQKKWYLVFQSGQPQYSTTDDIEKPETWTQPKDFFDGPPTNGTGKTWLDFFVICDKQYAYRLALV